MLKFGSRDEKDNFIQRRASHLSIIESIQDIGYCPLNNAEWTNLNNEQVTIEEQSVASTQYSTFWRQLPPTSLSVSTGGSKFISRTGFSSVIVTDSSVVFGRFNDPFEIGYKD